ncbi:MAG: PucR family transcriptional regulator [Sporichthyaceae bacterium]
MRAPDRDPVEVDPAVGFGWLLNVIHELAHAYPGSPVICRYLPAEFSPPGDGPDVIDLCATSPDASQQLTQVLIDGGVDAAELMEPTRMQFPALGDRQHVLVLPLVADGRTAGALVFAGPTPPLGKAGMTRVVELVSHGLELVRASRAQSQHLAVATAERAALDAELGTAQMFSQLSDLLIAARTTGEVVATLSSWLEAGVAVQLSNLIVAEAAGLRARELALSGERNEAEREIALRASSGERVKVLAASGRIPARVIAPITNSGGGVAGFLIAEVGPRGVDLTRRALEVPRSLISYQMSIRQDIEASVATLRQTLLSDLLEKRFSEHLVTQAAKLGHDLSTVHIPIAIGTVGVPLSKVADRLLRMAEHAATQASTASGASLFGVVEDMVIAFVPEPVPIGGAALAAQIAAEAAAESIPIAIGIGPVCARAADMPATAARARWTVDILRTTDVAGTRVAEFDDLGVYGLLFDHQRAAELTDYAQRWLGPLLEYDRRHRSELVETLRQLFRQRSLSDAAGALHIHISTLKYRVGRIEEILGRSVESWDNVFHLELALRILLISDHLNAPAHPFAAPTP